MSYNWVCAYVYMYVRNMTFSQCTYIATIEVPDLQGFNQKDSVATFILAQATAKRSERYISSLERTDLGVPLEVEFEGTPSSGADGDMIDRHVSAPGAVYNVQIWSINGASFSTDPQVSPTTLLFDTSKEIDITGVCDTLHTLVM